MAKAGDLASLLSTSERAVFHGAPGKAIVDLEQAVGVAQRDGLHAEVAAAAWLLGVASAPLTSARLAPLNGLYASGVDSASWRCSKVWLMPSDVSRTRASE